jgi:hypothetical protein
VNLKSARQRPTINQPEHGTNIDWQRRGSPMTFDYDVITVGGGLEASALAKGDAC